MTATPGCCDFKQHFTATNETNHHSKMAVKNPCIAFYKTLIAGILYYTYVFCKNMLFLCLTLV